MNMFHKWDLEIVELRVEAVVAEMLRLMKRENGGLGGVHDFAITVSVSEIQVRMGRFEYWDK
ncbi:hypothetical protein HanXRQr2_Chr17g0782121 [Helianthus annuus]|uniref:Uncharacterized protein n=1 Tax=Helianthus annuus TaxID=4232 RepID=A0A9K3DF18_HELAN|nr:hypothetical protein HanXRQr2_Chr17g0782121 [Helianthus annuus]